MNRKNKTIVILTSLLLSSVLIASAATLASCKSENHSDTTEFTSITLTNDSIINLKKYLLSNITNEKLTKAEFSSNLLQNVKNNFIVNNKNISNLILDAIFTNDNKIQITLNKNNSQYFLEDIFDNSLASLENNVLIIPINESITFYQDFNFINVDNLFNKLNEFISAPTRLYTFDEFVNNFEINKEQIKSIVLDNLETSNSNEQISSIFKSILIENRDLIIELNGFDNWKYTINKNQNISVNNNKLVVSNLEFYNEIKVENINQLKTKIQDYINNDDNLFTYDQFNSQLNDNNFKSQIATTIGINSNKIGEITFVNNLLTINPYSIVNNRNKFVASSNIKNGSIQIEINNLTYYSEIQVSNLDELQPSIIEYINESINQFTILEFESQLNSDDFKNKIATIIGIDKISIGNISYSNTTLKIEPNSSTNSKAKFISSESSKLIVNGLIQLSIPISNFYDFLQINVLIQLKEQIINYLNSNKEITKNDINSYLSIEMLSLFENTKTFKDQSLTDFIHKPTFSENSLNLKLKSNIKKFKFLSNSSETDGIIIKPNSISIELKDIELATPKESPESWFLWKGNEIRGLSDEGKMQKRIVLPSKASSIYNEAFWKSELFSVDMSLTSITNLPSGSSYNTYYSGVFTASQDLVSITLPNSLETIGATVFRQCSSLTSIVIPNTVTSIAYNYFGNAFSFCSSLTSITIPNSVKKIGKFSFYACSNLSSITMSSSVEAIDYKAFLYIEPNCVMYVSSTWDQTLATNAGYTGTFVIDDSL